MKIIQVPYCFHPDPLGGTEVYVEALSRCLQQLGIEVVIAAAGPQNQSYEYESLPVRRFAIRDVSDLRDLYGEGEEHAAAEFGHLLEIEKPDLIHLHAFTRAVSLKLVRTAKKHQIPVIFTYHTPTVSCPRGTLLHWGQQVCDGKLELHKCSRCTLQSLDLSLLGAIGIGSLPSQVGKGLGALGLQGGIWTLLRMTELLQLRHTSFQALMTEVDHVIAVCDWVRDLLIRNHVPESKISVNRQPLCHSIPSNLARKDHSELSQPLKLVFLGRLHPTKGLHVLCQALASKPDLPITLDIYGFTQAQVSNSYLVQLKAFVEKDPRIELKPPVPSQEIISTLATYDLLMVPSQWLETGPLVVLEAFAAGIPVMGSNLGGISELVKHEVNGILVSPQSVDEWAQALSQVCKHRSLLTQIINGIKLPETMEHTAAKMVSIYEAVSNHSSVREN